MIKKNKTNTSNRNREDETVKNEAKSIFLLLLKKKRKFDNFLIFKNKGREKEKTLCNNVNYQIK